MQYDFLNCLDVQGNYCLKSCCMLLAFSCCLVECTNHNFCGGFCQNGRRLIFLSFFTQQLCLHWTPLTRKEFSIKVGFIVSHGICVYLSDILDFGGLS